MSSNRRTARLQERLLLREPTVFTQGQWELVRNNVDKWELYCQFNGHRNWWVMVDAFFMGFMDSECSNDVLGKMFSADVRKGAMRGVMGFHDFCRGFSRSPFPAEKRKVQSMSEFQIHEARKYGDEVKGWFFITEDMWSIDCGELMSRLQILNVTEKKWIIIGNIMIREYERDAEVDFLEFMGIWKKYCRLQGLKGVERKLLYFVKDEMDRIVNINEKSTTSQSYVKLFQDVASM